MRADHPKGQPQGRLGVLNMGSWALKPLFMLLTLRSCNEIIYFSLLPVFHLYLLSLIFIIVTEKYRTIDGHNSFLFTDSILHLQPFTVMKREQRCPTVGTCGRNSPIHSLYFLPSLSLSCKAPEKFTFNPRPGSFERIVCIPVLEGCLHADA